MEKFFLYLDDVRTPNDPRWIVVRSYDEFVERVTEFGLENFEAISLDHDLGPQSTRHFIETAMHTGNIEYSAISEKTGLDCAKWMVETAMDTDIDLPRIVVHSANPVGSANIMSYINNYLYRERLPQTCVRVLIDHTVDEVLATKNGWNGPEQFK
jgi:hypothetical protein